MNLDPAGFSPCAPKTQIGTGTAEGTLTAADGTPSFVPVDLKAYNGGPIEGKPSIVFIGSTGGNPVAELDFTVQQTSSGLVLDDYMPPGTPPPTLFISKFDVTASALVKTKKVKGKRKVVASLFTTPSKCPKAGWKVTQTNTTAAGVLSAASTSPCVKLVKQG